MTTGPQPVTAQALVDEAARRAGHDDFGDPGFLVALELLVDGCRVEGRLTPVGWQVLRSVVLRHLRNRLALQAYLRRAPQIATVDLGAPVVITGLPRTGTSVLHNLLSHEAGYRFLRLREALRPAPDGHGPAPDTPTLRAEAAEWLERFYAHAPEFRAIHPLTPDGPEECDALLQNALASQHFDDMFDAPAYSHWFATADLTAEYAHYADALRVIDQTRESGRRWLLKSPGHLGHLDALFGVFPDAVVIWCHRAPIEAVSSYASLISTVRSANSEAVWPGTVGTQALQRCQAAMGRALAVRNRKGEDRFIDVAYAALARAPIAAVTEISQRLGRPLGAAITAIMQQWLDDHPRGRYGTHRYDPTHFGLSRQRVEPSFAGYRQRFAAYLKA